MGGSVIGCTDLSGKELHRHVGVGIVMASERLSGVMVNTLAWNVRDMGSIHALGTICHIVITHDTGFPDHVQATCLLN